MAPTKSARSRPRLEFADELEIVLSRGGDLEGEVVVDEPRERAGIVVGITRGDGFPRTQRTDPRGPLRFEYLTPARGTCTSTTARSSRVVELGSWKRYGPDHVWPTNAQVVEGRTSFLRLDLREPPLLRFRAARSRTSVRSPDGP
jgi:hypothetical protein